MFFRLLLLFTIAPLLELALLIEVGRRIGTAATILLVLGTGALGAAMAKSQGLAVIRRVRADMNEGRLPAEGLVDGLLIVVGGALLITPGLITDFLGFVLIFPSTRRTVKSWLRKSLAEWIETGSFRIYIR